MDTELAALQRAAERRVEQMRREERLIAETQGHRTAASLRAARPEVLPPISGYRPSPPPVPTAKKPPKQPDTERQMLLLLTLLLARCGASTDLLLVLLYLAL